MISMVGKGRTRMLILLSLKRYSILLQYRGSKHEQIEKADVSKAQHALEAKPIEVQVSSSNLRRLKSYSLLEQAKNCYSKVDIN